ncbi:hypothetical protein EDM38_14460, partial [Staphylococcus aureus]
NLPPHGSAPNDLKELLGLHAVVDPRLRLTGFLLWTPASVPEPSGVSRAGDFLARKPYRKGNLGSF